MPTIIPFSSAKTGGSITEVDEFETEIEGDRYRFVARWNALEQAWYLDIFDGEDAALIYGVRIATGVPLARWLRHPLTTRGMLIAGDTSGRFIDPGRYDLGTRVRVAHFTEAEVVAAISRSNL